MSRADPAVLASVLAEAVLRLTASEKLTAELWRKVAGSAEDLATFARAQEAACKRQERLDAKAEAAKSCPPFPCQKTAS